MEDLKVKINDTEYKLNTTLRVAYMVQTKFGHKPYMEVFKNLDTLKLEEQISILYEAFSCENPKEVTTITSEIFFNYILDHIGVIELNELVGGVIERIMYGGLTEAEVEAKKAKALALGIVR